MSVRFDTWFCLLQRRDFVKAGAEEGLTPSDVIQAADITFSCVSDPQAAKDVSTYRTVNVTRTWDSGINEGRECFGMFIDITKA